MSTRIIQLPYSVVIQQAATILRHPVCWFTLQIISLWPTLIWMIKRMTDGSDDPLGILAIGALVLIIRQQKYRTCQSPQKGMMIGALLCTIMSVITLNTVPMLLTGIFSMIALALSTLAFLPAHSSRLPVIGLFILTLPLLSSLQFYAGFPLRVITAEASAWLLQIFFIVQREGTSLLINGQTILVDAPCSGIQMAWFGYFTACTTALWLCLNNRQFILSLPFISFCILSGNIIRNTLLVTLYALHYPPSDMLHEIIGLLLLMLVCVLIILIINHKHDVSAIAQQPQLTASPSLYSDPSILVPIFYTGTGFFILCIFGSILKNQKEIQTETTPPIFVEWPTHWQGVAIRPIGLSAVDQRFAEGFPGVITPMTDDHRMFVFRYITKATRKLHPAADCYRGQGYTLSEEKLHIDAENKRWRCFIALQKNHALEVCEHIENNQGIVFTDTSAWYWHAQFNQNSGPWTAITIATPL